MLDRWSSQISSSTDSFPIREESPDRPHRLSHSGSNYSLANRGASCLPSPFANTRSSTSRSCRLAADLCRVSGQHRPHRSRRHPWRRRLEFLLAAAPGSTRRLSEAVPSAGSDDGPPVVTRPTDAGRVSVAAHRYDGSSPRVRRRVATVSGSVSIGWPGSVELAPTRPSLPRRHTAPTAEGSGSDTRRPPGVEDVTLGSPFTGGEWCAVPFAQLTSSVWEGHVPVWTRGTVFSIELDRGSGD